MEVEVKVEIGVEVEEKKRKIEKEKTKKPSVPKPGNQEKKMEYRSRVIQLRGSRPQGQLVLSTSI